MNGEKLKELLMKVLDTIPVAEIIEEGLRKGLEIIGNKYEGGEAMRKEVDSKVPMLKELGGYIPSSDHVIHVDFL